MVINLDTDINSALDEQVKVIFTPSGRRGSFAKGTPVLQAARALGVDIDSICGGRGLCGRCQILCSVGDFPKYNIKSKKQHLSPFSETEKRFEERRKPLLDGRRLSCHTQLEGDVVIDVPMESQVHRQVIRKDAKVRDITLDPAVHLYYVEVREPDLHDPSGDLQRLQEALQKEWALTDLECEISILQILQTTLREGEWKVTVAVYQGKRIIAIWPAYHDRAYGVAIDLGSTTIAGHLCELNSGKVVSSSGLMNPQIRFGEDLMSRVSYIMMAPNSAFELTHVVRDGLNSLIAQLAKQADVQLDEILELTFVANPIMHHLLLGINPVELGGAPFALTSDDAISLWASELKLNIQGNGRVYVLPCIAGHVGADTAGMIISEEPHLQDELTLLVDIGTNAEIVLGNKERLLVCSSPTGPAFEGAQISCGQRAAPGAIERVRIDAKTLEPRFKVIGSDRWSDDPEFSDSIKKFGVSGICGSGIIEAIAEMYLVGLIDEDGVIRGTLSKQSSRLIQTGRTWSYLLFNKGIEISVTQTDIREIQLAKAALYAGIKLLMDKIAVERVEHIRLAGAFGSHIDVKYAMLLGLIPDCPLDKVHSVGNAAGTGARIALLNQTARSDIQSLVKKIEKIETAVEEKFQEYFVAAMTIPNKTDPFTNLFSVVEKPVKSASIDMIEDNTKKKRRRRRGKQAIETSD